LIWGLTILLLYEATTRVVNKTIVSDPLIMVITAAGGLVCNFAMAKVLHSSPGHSHAGHDHGHSHGHSHKHGAQHEHKHGAEKK